MKSKLFLLMMCLFSFSLFASQNNDFEEVPEAVELGDNNSEGFDDILYRIDIDFKNTWYMRILCCRLFPIDPEAPVYCNFDTCENCIRSVNNVICFSCRCIGACCCDLCIKPFENRHMNEYVDRHYAEIAPTHTMIMGRDGVIREINSPILVSALQAQAQVVNSSTQTIVMDRHQLAKGIQADRAATKIQALGRGFVARQKLKKEK